VEKFEFAMTRVAFYSALLWSIVLSIMLEAFRYIQLVPSSATSLSTDLSKLATNESSNYTYQQYAAYYIEYTSLGITDLVQAWALVDVLVRDLLISFLLLILDVLVLFKAGQISAEIRSLNTAETTDSNTISIVANETGSNNSMLSKALLRSERRKCVLVAVMGVVYAMGHVGNGVSVVQQVFFPNGISGDSAWSCFGFVAGWLVSVEYASGFVVYYAFSGRFRKLVNGNLRSVFRPMGTVFRVEKMTLMQTHTVAAPVVELPPPPPEFRVFEDATA
jgi:hypothetical protein